MRSKVSDVSDVSDVSGVLCEGKPLYTFFMTKIRRFNLYDKNKKI